MARKSKVLERVIGLLVLGALVLFLTPQPASAEWAPENDIALVNAKCPSIKTNVVETSYPYGIAVHHTVGNGGGDWFQASVGAHCGEDRPPYLIVIDKDGVAHQTAEFGSRINHARCNQYGVAGQCANTDYVAVAVVGDFRTDELTPQQQQTLMNVFQWLARQGAAKIVLGHRDVGKINGYTTECPGDNIYALLPELTDAAFNDPTALLASPPTTVTLPSSAVRLSVLPCLITIFGAGGLLFWLAKKPEANTKKLLALLAKVQDWRHRRALLKELRSSQDKHFVRIGLAGVVALVLVYGGFRLKDVGVAAESCSFVPVLADHADGSWDFGVATPFQDYHTGADKMGKLDEPIPASASGTVVWADWWPGNPEYKQLNIGHGNTVVIETSCNGVKWYHFYAHLNEINVKVGQEVSQGDVIGFMGQTGASRGVHLHFAVSQKGPTEDHGFQDWVNPEDFVKQHQAVESENFWDSVKPFGFKVIGWSLIVMAVLIVWVFSEGRGFFVLLRQSLVPGALLAMLMLFSQLAPVLMVTKFNWKNLAEVKWEELNRPAYAVETLKLPEQQFLAGASVQDGMQDIPDAFKQEVIALGPQVIQIGKEENVPPSVIFTLWLKERGGQRNNPSNGEGLCGFYTRVKSGVDYFPPGPIDEAEVLRQLRLCAQEFRKHAREYASQLSYDTADYNVLGPIFMVYNGNIDCHGDPFPSWRDHPYVMNGYDADHQHMVARDGKGGCVPLSIIGAVPADLRIRSILQGE